MADTQDFTMFDRCLVYGIPILDTQHANLMRIINNLQLACLKGASSAGNRFWLAVHEAIEYIQYHFETEEKLMFLFNYPELHDHKNEHANLIWEVSNRVKEFKEEENPIPENLVTFFGEWIISHAGVFDKAFANYFVETESHSKLRVILNNIPQVSATSA